MQADMASSEVARWATAMRRVESASLSKPRQQDGGVVQPIQHEEQRAGRHDRPVVVHMRRSASCARRSATGACEPGRQLEDEPRSEPAGR
eukprot:7337449-Pyramimonas_sp.AAC.1